MKIIVTSVMVDDQEKALRFYTEVLGFSKKNDVPAGAYRWLTVVSPVAASRTRAARPWSSGSCSRHPATRGCRRCNRGRADPGCSPGRSTRRSCAG